MMLGDGESIVYTITSSSRARADSPTARVPVSPRTGLQLGAIIAFAIITETVFQWPGMGLLFIQSVQFADIPVMAAYLCLIALFFVVINLVVDLLYYAVDPRLRLDRAAAGRRIGRPPGRGGNS